VTNESGSRDQTAHIESEREFSWVGIVPGGMQIALFGGSLAGPRPGSGMGDEREMDYGDDRMVRLTVL
jgi:hypothetical protein